MRCLKKGKATLLVGDSIGDYAKKRNIEIED